jgi:hypothetical protein
MRGRRLRGFGGTLCDVCVAARLPELRASVGGVPCGIHSSERSSSQGCVVLAMVVLQLCGAVKGVFQAVVSMDTRRGLL